MAKEMKIYNYLYNPVILSEKYFRRDNRIRNGFYYKERK